MVEARRVNETELRTLGKSLFLNLGMEESDAGLLADSLVAADLRGVHSHGVMRIPDYAAKLSTRGVDPRGRPAIVRDSGACLVVDGHNSMGQVGAQFAIEEVIERADANGIAAASIRGSNHCGAMAYFAMQALSHDMIGIAATNSLAMMAPWGGTERLFGINPMAVAIPGGAEGPIVHDAAFSASSYGKIRIHEQEGRSIPPGWALDDSGAPTTDPAEVAMLLPIGEFKGVGLAIVTGVLCSMLSGAAFGTELGDREHGPTAGIDGHFVAAIAVSAFEDVDRFKERIDKVVRQIHECPRAAGTERLYAPGEREALTEESYRRDGIPLNPVTLGEIRDVVRGRGMEPPGWLE